MAPVTVSDLEATLDITFFPYQLEAFDEWTTQPADKQRQCLYYRTGAGKSITALCLLALNGDREALVIAPPVTHFTWLTLGVQLGITVTTVSHAKFRQKNFKVSRSMPVICDEFHLLGGHKGIGWKKFDRMAASLQAPAIILSATPNYNDAERCYCIERILTPETTRGGFIEFLYRTCETQQNPYGMEPLVKGFRNGMAAAEYLANLPHVIYLEDTATFTIDDAPYPVHIPDELETYGLNRRKGRIIASQMEDRWARVDHHLLDAAGGLSLAAYKELARHIEQADTPVLVFAASRTIAEAVAKALSAKYTVECVTGSTPARLKTDRIEAFKRRDAQVLVGTSTLATGTDGIDKICDHLIIVHDTDDDALRRQLIGRILPRGAATFPTTKTIVRMVPYAA